MQDDTSTVRLVARRFVGVAAALVLAACSSGSARPPDLGDCLSTDGGCTVSPGGGGGSSSDDGSTTTCGVSADDSMCTLCAGESCCAGLSTCFGNAGCQNLLNCEESCGGFASCVTACEDQFAASLTAFDELETCLTTRCPVCSQAGVGDPCIPGETACNAGLVCQRSWCTKACVGSTGCTGLGAGGGNALGLPNACIATTSGDICFPGCASDSDCAEFPGTYCFATTAIEGAGLQVCTPFPDAGTE
jgi:hypothetical protein